MKILKRDLFTKRSGLKAAGRGLFTRVNIRKGDRIVEYRGRKERWVLVKHLDGHNGYLLRLNRSTAINAEPYKKALGRYANDAMGLTRIAGVRNNGEYVVDGDRCFIEATRNIEKGEEIFVGYGIEYWRLIRRLKGRL